MSIQFQETEVKIQTRQDGVTVLPASNITVQKIRSLDEWKAMNLDLKSLRPAVLKGQKIIFMPFPGQL